MRAPSWLAHHFRTTLMPLVLMATTPVVNLLLWMVCKYYGGSLLEFIQATTWDRLVQHWPNAIDLVAVTIVLSFAVLEALLMIYVPGETHKGPVTPAGSRPTYKLNGVACYVITSVLLVGGFYTQTIPLGLVYDAFGEVLLFMTVFAFLFCIFLSDFDKRDISKDFISHRLETLEALEMLFGTFIGVLNYTHRFLVSILSSIHMNHPASLFDALIYCNCRLGMMGWHCLLLCFAAKQVQLYGAVSNSMLASILLQEIYIAKFFVWEGGYFGSLDIMHDRFGYYICWGVLCWIAGVYSLVGHYLVQHPLHLSNFELLFTVLTGIFLIWANYDADAQRQRVRETAGKCAIWGKPPKTLVAKYKTLDGKEQHNILLLSGWWGVSRHAHYMTEILSAVMWTLPAGKMHILPWFYVVFLTVLLFDRSYRDELRCRAKYGAYWQKYCNEVPYSIVPFIY